MLVVFYVLVGVAIVCGLAYGAGRLVKWLKKD